MVIFYQFLIGFLAATSCAMAAGQNAVHSGNESEPIVALDKPEKTTTNVLTTLRWELLNAYDQHGNIQTDLFNEGMEVFSSERLLIWFNHDYLGTKVCNFMSWRYSADPQGQITLEDSFTTMAGCDEPTNRLEIRVSVSDQPTSALRVG
ncbi:hypothetical protein E9531_13250 [Lampropedia puyangensis]|uniref:META domain-containing protein n=1 Tax=Lampropedia puyangensis TaxID=1330072 RepID=A0A4S8EWZ5_9BURK|nr:hypothetical protein [Lampropedia puyangensis]THT99038.1 hypothetical protein E9531_13250 [Lampropedia puyangensis]